MSLYHKCKSRSLLLIVAGLKGAVGSTLTVAVAALQSGTENVISALTTRDKFPYLGPAQQTHIVGWDLPNRSLLEAVQQSGILPESIWKSYVDDIDKILIKPSPSPQLDLKTQVNQLMEDIRFFQYQFSQSLPVFINLLPACSQRELNVYKKIEQLYSEVAPAEFPDIAYALAAIRSGVPIVNFTPNKIEVPLILAEANNKKVPIAGRDGKTGQTYLKVVLASALKARNLSIDGWYSLNILGNADGENLMDPKKAAEKVKNKTDLLNEILGYPVGNQYGMSTHKVHIDYYPPRGDAKEAWDVIDFKGLFGLPMSIRLNLMGRDSILAAPLSLDLARWLAALKLAGYSGPISELGFYFKKPVGAKPPLTFQAQMGALEKLEKACNRKVGA